MSKLDGEGTGEAKTESAEQHHCTGIIIGPDFTSALEALGDEATDRILSVLDDSSADAIRAQIRRSRDEERT